MKVNFPFVSHLKYRLYVYLAVLLCVPVATCFIVNAKTKPKAHEKFSLFIGAEVIKKDEFNTELSNLLAEDLEIKVEGIKETDNLFQTKLDSFGRSCDILIMSRTVMEKQEYIPYFALKEGNKYYSETNFIAYENHIGILLNENTDCFLSNYVDLKEEPYYAVISEKTVHGEGFNETYSTNQVDKVLNLLLGR